MFAAAVAIDPTRPLLTWYDDATGDRTELSGATLDNWVAKTANLLIEARGGEAGEVAVVDLPPHWQTAAVLLGCWSAGLVVTGPDGPAGDVRFVTEPAAVAVTGADVYGLALAPFAAPMRGAPPGVLDFPTEVRGQADRFTPYQKVEPDHPAAVTAATTLTHRELCARAAAGAARHGLTSGARVLVDAARHPDPVDWLLAPLAGGASIVLCGHLDGSTVDRRVGAERVTARLR
jgi:uncharacterized protein (TIGR03089 family)